MALQKPLDYWIARATDSFISSSERKQFLDKLCEKISEEAEGAEVAMKQLAHKMLSPNQTEALHALRAIDACVQHCGSRVHNEIGKFRFLNQFVKLLSPQYHGETISEDVRKQAVQMLYIWQKTMRYLPKLKQVYEMLKEQHVLEDPQLSYEPACITPSSRLAAFEDEEKAALLSQLLKSSNKEDLQAANRLIRSMVRSEDQKIERLTKRTNDLEKAKSACRVLNEVFAYGGVELSSQETELAQELLTTVTEIRPSLFRYAGEAAENNDSALADILAVNDSVNKTVTQYSRLCHKKSGMGRIENLVSIDCPTKRSDNNILNADDMSRTSFPYDVLFELPKLVKRDTSSDEKPLMNIGEKDAVEEEAALIVMGPDTKGSSALYMPVEEKFHSALNDLSVLMTSLTASDNVESTPETITGEHGLDKIDLFGSEKINALLEAAVAFGFHGIIRGLQANDIPSSLKTLSVTLNQLQLNSRIPITMFDEKGIKGMLCFAENPVPDMRRLITTIVSLVSSYTHPVHHVKLSLSCKNQDIETRLFEAERDSFPAFSPISALPTITQVFLILLPTGGFSSIDLDYVLLFSAPSPNMISGTFPLYFS